MVRKGVSSVSSVSGFPRFHGNAGALERLKAAENLGSSVSISSVSKLVWKRKKSRISAAFPGFQHSLFIERGSVLETEPSNLCF
jgi:hypothetical protein